jgi:DNA invertase Pin-like site-specific DNA recombinase
MIYGYARVSTDGQTVGAQVEALTAAGAVKVFRETASGAQTDRAQLRKVLAALEAGDVLMVTRLDRLARSTRDLLNTLAAITDRKSGFRSLGDTWADTTTPHGRLMVTMLGGLAEFERELIRARTGEGRARAVARGAWREVGAQAEADAAPEERDSAPQGEWRGRAGDCPQLQRPQQHDFEADSLTMLTKLEVARRQLGTAFDLFIRDRDPVSVQSLACGAGEILDVLAEQAGTEPFSTHILATRPDLDMVKIRQIRNQFWNAFKHATTHKGEPRDDAMLLNAFSDEQNDGALFIGWHDYGQVAGRLPISAQVFQVWYQVLADAEKRMNPDVDMIGAHRVFPGLVELSRKDQKRRLTRAIEKYKDDKKLLCDAKTETQPLVFNAIL